MKVALLTQALIAIGFKPGAGMGKRNVIPSSYLPVMYVSKYVCLFAVMVVLFLEEISQPCPGAPIGTIATSGNFQGHKPQWVLDNLSHIEE